VLFDAMTLKGYAAFDFTDIFFDVPNSIPLCTSLTKYQAPGPPACTQPPSIVSWQNWFDCDNRFALPAAMKQTPVSAPLGRSCLGTFRSLTRQ
jgi:hypothetical protein